MRSLFVVRTGATVRAYENSCPHTGGPLDWVPDQFLTREKDMILCATHGALFRIGRRTLPRRPLRRRAAHAAPGLHRGRLGRGRSLSVYNPAAPKSSADPHRQFGYSIREALRHDVGDRSLPRAGGTRPLGPLRRRNLPRLVRPLDRGFGGVLGRARQADRLDQALQQGEGRLLSRRRPPHPLVRGRHAQRLCQLRRPAPGGARRPGGDRLGGRRPGRGFDADLPRAARRRSRASPTACSRSAPARATASPSTCR